MKIIILVGNCGSGKTYYIHHSGILNDLNDPLVIDDPMFESDIQLLKNALEYGRDVIVADPWFCISKNLQKMCKLIPNKYEREIIYFENDLENCLANCQRRRMKEGKIVNPEFVRRLSFEYDPPTEAKKIPVWCENTVDKLQTV